MKASCPGLTDAAGQVKVARGETVRWLPWPQGYLAVESNPPGATILVDQVQRGVTPQVVEVEPGTLHKVDLTLAKYAGFHAEASTSAGSKKNVAGTLAALPGSVRIQTDRAGTLVRMDAGEWKQTPCLYLSLAAGAHAIEISPILVDRRYYAYAGTVDVKPGELTAVEATLTPAKAHLRITDAPPQSTVTVEGAAVDSALALTTGVEVPAGTLDILVTSPTRQTWQGSVSAMTNTTEESSVTGFTTLLQKRTITMTGKKEEWEGIWPQWVAKDKTDTLKTQPGTSMTKAYACRDDQSLYCRIDFDDGSPTTNLTKDVPTRLDYCLEAILSGGETLLMRVSFAKAGQYSSVRLWNSNAGRDRTISEDVRYHIGESMIEIAVPLSRIQRYVADAPHSFGVLLENVEANGRSSSTRFLGFATIDLGK
jgi:hypothetical protein